MATLRKQTRKYLTLGMAKQLKPGHCLRIGYNDFNVGTDDIRVIGPSDRKGISPFYLKVHSIKDGFDYEIGADNSRQQAASLDDYPMCRGSGAERIFIIKDLNHEQN